MSIDRLTARLVCAQQTSLKACSQQPRNTTNNTSALLRAYWAAVRLDKHLWQRACTQVSLTELRSNARTPSGERQKYM